MILTDIIKNIFFSEDILTKESEEKKNPIHFSFGRFMPSYNVLVPGFRVLFRLAMTWIEIHSFSLLNECHYLAVGYKYSYISKNFISVYTSSGIGILLMFHFIVLKVFWPHKEIWRPILNRDFYSHNDFFLYYFININTLHLVKAGLT